MSIGIGLGAFMDGFQDGQRFMDQKADAAYKKELRQRQTDDFNRQEEGRKNLEAINADTAKTFDGLVQNGEKKEEDRADFFRHYALPKMHAEHLRRGDLDGATRLKAWGETEDAKKGASLSQSALLKLQTNDYVGALNDAMEASRVKGYYKTDFKFTGHTPFKDQQGNLVGYRLSGKNAAGEDFHQDVPLNKLPTLIATFTNPEAAWQSQQAASQQKAADTRALDLHDRKKQIDQKYSSNSKGRTDAIKSLRDRHDGMINDGPKFDDMSKEQQERLISEELSLQQGPSGTAGPSSAPGLAQPSQGSADGEAAQQRPAVPGRKVIIDTVTGQPVAAPTPASGASPVEAPPPPASRQPVPGRRPAPSSQGPAPSQQTAAAPNQAVPGRRPAPGLAQPAPRDQQQAQTVPVPQPAPRDQQQAQTVPVPQPAPRDQQKSAEESAVATRRDDQKQDPAKERAITQAKKSFEKNESISIIVRNLRKAGVQEKDWPMEILTKVKQIRRDAKALK